MRKHLRQSAGDRHRMQWIAAAKSCFLLAALVGATHVAFAQQVAVPTITTPASATELTIPAATLTGQQIASMQQKLADWPQLARYREANAKLAASVAAEPRVVFYGDSITDAWGRQRGKFFPDKPWINRGISGQTTPQMLVRFRQDVLDLHPEAVVILAGINDIAGNTGPETLSGMEDNFRSMVALAQAEHVRTVLSSVLPATQIPWRRGVDPKEEVAALNTWLRQFALEQHLIYLDYFPAMAGPDGGMRPGLSLDGIHPTDAGYAIMEPLALAAVNKSLAQPRP